MKIMAKKVCRDKKIVKRQQIFLNRCHLTRNLPKLTFLTMKRLVLSLDKHCSFLFPFYTWRKYEGSVKSGFSNGCLQGKMQSTWAARVRQLYTAILYMKSQNSITIIFTIKSLFLKILILHTRIFSRSLEVGGLKK